MRCVLRSEANGVAWLHFLCTRNDKVMAWFESILIIFALFMKWMLGRIDTSKIQGCIILSEEIHLCAVGHTLTPFRDV